MLIQGKLLSFGDDLSDAFEIRREVFVEEMGILPEIEFNDEDNMAVHAIIYEETAARIEPKENGEHAERKRAVATGRMMFDGEICRIEHIAVLKDFRGRQYDELVIRILLNKAFTSGIHKVMAHVPASMLELFTEIGFHTDHDEIIEQGKPYYNMVIRSRDFTSPCNRNRKI